MLANVCYVPNRTVLKLEKLYHMSSVQHVDYALTILNYSYN